MNLKRIYILGSMIVVALHSAAWDWWPLAINDTVPCRDTLLYGAEVRALSSSGNYAPYWLQTNRDGDIAASPHSGNLRAGVIKPATCPTRWWDWDAGVSLTGRLQSTNDALNPAINQIGTGYANLLYAHVRLYIVDITAGIKPQSYGVADETLSSGGLLYSNNAHPMPRITIGFDNWTPFPGLFGYVEFRGGWSHEWMADNVYIKSAKIHHKWLGGRLGGRLPINISYEFHHVAQWGGYSPIYGDLGNDWAAYKAAILVQSGGSMMNDQKNAQGNHIGSQILTLDIKGKGWKVSAYWHNIFEDGPIRFIGFGMNAKDGLWGINVTQNRWLFISGVTYEFLNTTDQSGPYHDKDGMIFGGADSYYTNLVYRNGWNYFYRTIGNAFITSPVYNSDGYIATRNNRVQAHYIGIKGDIYGYHYRIVTSYAKNYGQYQDGQSPNAMRSSNVGWLIEVNKHVEQAWGLDFGVSIAGDAGSQFGNTFGAMITIRKQGIIYSY